MILVNSIENSIHGLCLGVSNVNMRFFAFEARQDLFVKLKGNNFDDMLIMMKGSTGGSSGLLSLCLLVSAIVNYPYMDPKGTMGQWFIK